MNFRQYDVDELYYCREDHDLILLKGINNANQNLLLLLDIFSLKQKEAPPLITGGIVVQIEILLTKVYLQFQWLD